MGASRNVSPSNGNSVTLTHYYNRDKKAHAPTDYMITQTVKADANGVFSYAAPRSGWWGFSALNTADYQLENDGVKKDVELGAVIWVEFLDWNEK